MCIQMYMYTHTHKYIHELDPRQKQTPKIHSIVVFVANTWGRGGEEAAGAEGAGAEGAGADGAGAEAASARSFSCFFFVFFSVRALITRVWC